MYTVKRYHTSDSGESALGEHLPLGQAKEMYEREIGALIPHAIRIKRGKGNRRTELYFPGWSIAVYIVRQ